MEIILASRSPRRKKLLKKVIKNFKVIPSNVDEKNIEEKNPVNLAIRAATLKAKNVGDKFPESLVIGADTVVVLGNKVLGKPENKEEARNMLHSLSGTNHKVITAIALYQGSKKRLLKGYEITRVKFKNLSSAEIEEYLSTKNYQGKAGSYGVQKIGDKFVEIIEGDYENVVGLPLKKLVQLLKKFGKDILRNG